MVRTVHGAATARGLRRTFSHLSAVGARRAKPPRAASPPLSATVLAAAKAAQLRTVLARATALHTQRARRRAYAEARCVPDAVPPCRPPRRCDTAQRARSPPKTRPLRLKPRSRRQTDCRLGSPFSSDFGSLCAKVRRKTDGLERTNPTRLWATRANPKQRRTPKVRWDCAPALRPF